MCRIEQKADLYGSYKSAFCFFCLVALPGCFFTFFSIKPDQAIKNIYSISQAVKTNIWYKCLQYKEGFTFEWVL